MNDFARRMVDGRQRRKRADYEMSDYARGNRARRGSYDMRLSDPIGTEPEYPYETDGKQGVKGTGPYGIGGRLYSRNRDYTDYEDYDDYDYEMDERRGSGRRPYRDYAEYEMDGHHPSGLMRLKKKDFMKWERQLENADGSQGKHFDAHQIKKIAEQMGIKYRGYDEKDLCMTVNMLYSDYCEVLKGMIPTDKEIVIYTKLAQAWLEDPDSPVEGSEKLALYYWCIVNDEE